MAKKKYIETPEKLLELFNNYKNWAEENPIEKTIKGNKNFIISHESLKRPLTMEGFENYCFDKGHINDLGDYFSNKNGQYSDYSTICSYIKRQVRQDQIEGGLVGIYNPSITQRLNGLVEKVQEEKKVKVYKIIDDTGDSNSDTETS